MNSSNCFALIAILFLTLGCKDVLAQPAPTTEPTDEQFQIAIKSFKALGAAFGPDLHSKAPEYSLEIDLRLSKATDADLKDLANLKNLTSVQLSQTQGTDAGLKELAKCVKLSSVDLNDTQATDVGLRKRLQIA